MPTTARILLLMATALLYGVSPLLAEPGSAEHSPGVKVLFLGDEGHHQPLDRFLQVADVLANRGIELQYTDRLADLNPNTLSQYDGLVVYANIDDMTPEAEQALLDFVRAGKGLIALHCASYCFRNSPAYVELVGGQFESHETGEFRVTPVATDHPILKGYGGFFSWDETYVHRAHNTAERTVLERRGEEPWTWVRTQDNQRVFYTAWGHDQRTWSHPGFQNLLERGIRWACRADLEVVEPYTDLPAMTTLPAGEGPFEFQPAEVPFYPASDKWGTQGEPLRQMQRPLSPAESMQRFVTPVGFHVELFASEPDIGKPLCMAWDERGRLWIAESVDYPNDLQPSGAGRDRIRICEDTDQDGKADRFTVFADRLSIPTSIAFGHGGLIVHQAPITLFLRDTNGDDVADERTVLLEGWNSGDTHAGPSNLMYGLDGWYYGVVGYAGFEGTICGEQVSFRQGLYRFRLSASGTNAPTVSTFEFLRSTNNNTWGIGQSESGGLFASTANNCPSVYLPLPNRVYEQVRGWSPERLESIAASNDFLPVTTKVRQMDWHGGFTAAAGHALYTARAYPPEYWNQTAFVTEPTGHLVATFVLREEGGNYQSRYLSNLLASDDEWSAPTMAEVGPDGHVWVVDWYNFIIQHNPTPEGFQTGKGNAYVTDLRDKTHGRIYRVVYDHATETAQPTLNPQSPPTLVAALGHSNLLWRRHAQRLLIERGERDVVPALLASLEDTHADRQGLNPAALHAVWTLDALLPPDDHDVRESAARKAHASRSPAVRAASFALASTREVNRPVAAKTKGTDGILSVSGDRSTSVLMAELRALTDSPVNPLVAARVVELLGDRRIAKDRWLADAAIGAAAGQETMFLIALAEANNHPLAGPVRVRLIDRVAEHIARGAEESNASQTIQNLLNSVSKLPPSDLDALSAGLLRGWKKEAIPTWFTEQATQATAMLTRFSPAAQSNWIALLQRWQTPGIESAVSQLVANRLAQLQQAELADDARLAAARELISLQPNSSEIVEQILQLIDPRTPIELAEQLIIATGQSQAVDLGKLLTAQYSRRTPRLKETSVRVLLANKGTVAALLDAAEQGTLPLIDLTADQKQALLAYPDEALSRRSKELLVSRGELPNADRQRVIEELLSVTQTTGDAVRGKEVFTKQCSKCHQHSGEGKRVGPDLTGMAVHPKLELLTHILDPSRSVEGNFRVWTVATESGRVLTGMLASETRTTIELIDAEAKATVINRSEIDELIESPKSLMPEGLERQIPPQELADLLQFLTKRGRFVPIPIDRAATVVTTSGMFYAAENDVERLIYADWSTKTYGGIPYQLIDPQGNRRRNAIELHSPIGKITSALPRSVKLPCNSPAKGLHLLGMVSGWGFPATPKGTVSLIVRLHYADGQTEDHPLLNGEHFADYIRRVDVPGSEFAEELRGQQVRTTTIIPQQQAVIAEIELLKGPDETAPVLFALTVESP